MGGTFDKVPIGGSRAQYAACGWKCSGDVAGTCTLLGPEGPDAALERRPTSGPFPLPAVPVAEKVPPVL